MVTGRRAGFFPAGCVPARCHNRAHDRPPPHLLWLPLRSDHRLQPGRAGGGLGAGLGHRAGLPFRRHGAHRPPGRKPGAAFEIIEAALAEAGATLRDVVRTRMFLTAPADVDSVSAVHGALFADIRPAATMVLVAGLVVPAWKVEIEAEAVLRARRSRLIVGRGYRMAVAASSAMVMPRRSPTRPGYMRFIDVADGQLGLEVHDDDRAAVAAPVTGARADGHVGVGQPVAHAEAQRHPQAPCRCPGPAARR